MDINLYECNDDNFLMSFFLYVLQVQHLIQEYKYKSNVGPCKT